MTSKLHLQSLIAGAVLGAALTTFLSPTLAQSNWRDTARSQPEPRQVGQRGHEPEAAPVGDTVIVSSGRFQIETNERIAYLIDTETGEVWKDRDFSDQAFSTRGFFDHKIHNHR